MNSPLLVWGEGDKLLQPRRSPTPVWGDASRAFIVHDLGCAAWFCVREQYGVAVGVVGASWFDAQTPGAAASSSTRDDDVDMNDAPLVLLGNQCWRLYGITSMAGLNKYRIDDNWKVESDRKKRLTYFTDPKSERCLRGRTEVVKYLRIEGRPKGVDYELAVLKCDLDEEDFDSDCVDGWTVSKSGKSQVPIYKRAL